MVYVWANRPHETCACPLHWLVVGWMK
jgi:hypothetical protein